MITDAEDYFSKGCGRGGSVATADCSTRHWARGLAELRRICLDAGLSETVKWGHPCYMSGDRNIALIGAFRGDFRLNFMNASLLQDPEGLLEKRGPNTRHPDMLRFSVNEQVLDRELVIRAYLQEAVSCAEAGIRPQKQVDELELPDELVEALDVDPELAEAFHDLTPGRQRSYVLNLNSAKKAETRVSRIAGFRDKIIAGKGALER
jgi:uncharacterized protein YdeI (YjbR/CyaY-like superfamily)